ncbi:unnamed protein product [Parnassius apollo]|uniref:(apollo) hypothetical protein n=1 Tax=Parnassius apollo TaxID=110799 RepID=A0A8S3Y370_PARAO|nr:unnamed protein product [Parnassius apollo]
MGGGIKGWAAVSKDERHCQRMDSSVKGWAAVSGSVKGGRQRQGRNGGRQRMGGSVKGWAAVSKDEPHCQRMSGTVKGWATVSKDRRQCQRMGGSVIELGRRRQYQKMGGSVKGWAACHRKGCPLLQFDSEEAASNGLLKADKEQELS